MNAKPNSSLRTFEQLIADEPTTSFAPVMERELLEKSLLLDLSDDNQELAAIDIRETALFQNYIDGELEKQNARCGIGGYLEKRGRYANSPVFTQTEEPRSIHLGIDIWAPAGNPVYVPLDGTVHSFQDNANYFDYGPTIILRHQVGSVIFHTLYGHQSRESLEPLSIGMPVRAGERLSALGGPEVNGDWPPHLHFQIIIDMQDNRGDYPGVAAPSDLSFYQENCPDPALILERYRS